MRKIILTLFFIIIACEADKQKEKATVFNNEIIGRWKTDRNDNCDIFTEFFDNDSLVNTRNSRVIKGVFKFYNNSGGRVLKSKYTFDDGNLAASCDEDATIFEDQTFIFPATLSEDGNTLKLFVERTDTTALAVLRKQI